MPREFGEQARKYGWSDSGFRFPLNDGTIIQQRNSLVDTSSICKPCEELTVGTYLESGSRLPKNYDAIIDQRDSLADISSSKPCMELTAGEVPAMAEYTPADRPQRTLDEKQQEHQDLLLRSISGKAAWLIYKCFLHWGSFEDKITNIFARIFQTITSAIIENGSMLPQNYDAIIEQCDSLADISSSKPCKGLTAGGSGSRLPQNYYAIIEQHDSLVNTSSSAPQAALTGGESGSRLPQNYDPIIEQRDSFVDTSSHKPIMEISDREGGSWLSENKGFEDLVNTSPHSSGDGDKRNNATEDNTGVILLKLCEAAVPFAHVTGQGGVYRGIKGHRPSMLTPPPVMILPVPDDGCSASELIRGLAPDGHGPPLSSYLDSCRFSGNNEEGDLENALRGSLSAVRTGETIIRSGSCSFPTSDDDSSSTTTEPLSIISPNGGCRSSINHWEKGKLLGRGSFGAIYEAVSSGGDFFAVKEVSLIEQGSQAKQSIFYLEQEIELLSQFQHENIVRYRGTDKDESKLYIFLELATQGSLANLYENYHFRDSHVCAYTRQILLGLKYLHDRDVIHRDIKCANIMVGADGTVKLANFWLAKKTKLNDLKSCKGTAFWMAPEVLNHKNQGYGLAADIWSLGCTVLEMLTGHVPYYPMEFMRALFRIGQGEPPPIPDSLSRDAKDLIGKCLRVNPKDRPTAAELLEHPFVQRPLYAQAGSKSPMPRRY